jgi:hypothetical protein
VANKHVNLFRTGDFGDLAGNRNIDGFNTDASGFFTVSQIAPETHLFTVYVEWHKPCAKKLATFSLPEVFLKGIVSEKFVQNKN